MSSDCFDVRVKSVRGDEVILDVLTNTAECYDDLCDSRSFALVAMHGALQSAVDNKLVKALENEDDWYGDAAWMKKNIGRFIKSCELVERRNDVGEEELSRRAAAIENEFGGTLYDNQSHLWGPRRWALCHNYTLRVIVADPQWAAHLEEGLEWGTTAYDVWYERPATA